MSESEATDASPRARRPGGRTARVAERLWSAALELLGEKGVDGLQYDELAHRARVGRATVYRRWPSRDDLISDVLERFAETSVPIRHTADVVEDLTDFLRSFADAVGSPVGRAVLQILLRPVGDADRFDSIRRDVLARRTSDLQRRLDAATVSGHLPSVDAYFVNMMLAGPVQWSILREDEPFTRNKARRVVEVVVEGLRREVRERGPNTSSTS